VVTGRANSAAAAADRFFRLYAKHCREPDEDSLLALLESLHGLNDKLKLAEGGDLFASGAFTALKALRNLFHHEAELVHQVKVVPAASFPTLSTDLMIMCLVQRPLVEQAFTRLNESQRDIARGALKWYGPVVNIQPRLFNVAVDVYELVRPLYLDLKSPDFLAFLDSYEHEEQQGHGHRVSGDIVSRAGDVNGVLQAIFG